jgi:8-oxo-dGTP diphosphatase
MIEVCCAIILKDSKILAVQRGAESSHPNKWEFPGGKIQVGETAEQCICREIREELTVKVKILSRLKAFEFDYGNKQIKLIPFVCEIASGEIIMTEHQAQQWFSISDWQIIDWLEADSELIIRDYQTIRSLAGEIKD